MPDPSKSLRCDVWIFHSGTNSVPTRLQTNVLSDDERNRATGYRDVSRRMSYIASRAGIREILAHYLNVEPAEVPLRRLPSGKPIVAYPSRSDLLSISISHTAKSVCLAVASAGSCVGVDIERLDSLTYPQSLFRTFITTQEQHLFGGLSVEAQRRLMLEIWTIKEATFKAVGCEMRRSMAEIVVGGQPGALWLSSVPGMNAELQLAQFQAIEPTSSVEKNGACAETLFGGLVMTAAQPQEASEAIAAPHCFARVRENHNSIVDRMVQSGLECRLEEFLFGAATASEAGRSVCSAARSLATTGSSACGS